MLLTCVCMVLWCVGGDGDGGGGCVLYGVIMDLGGGHLCWFAKEER